MVLVLCLFAIVSFVHAQYPQPTLTSIFPSGGQAGTTVEVKIAGTDLDEATLRFEQSGISAQRDAKDSKKFIVTIAKDAQPMGCDVRVVSKLGVSNPRRFVVGSEREIISDGKNTKQEQALELPVPCVLSATAGSQQDQWFRIALKAGQSVMFAVDAGALDSRMAPLLTLMDANGRQLAKSRGDLTHNATSDGNVLLKLHDYLYRGGADYFYRLRVAEGKAKPAAAPVVASQEPHAVALPFQQCVSASAKAQFKFTAKKGDVWWIEVVSSGKADPRAVVQRFDNSKLIDVLELNDSRTVPGMPDYDGSSLDPTGKWEVKDDGEYLLTVRDLMRSSASTAIIQVSVAKPQPDFKLVAIPVPPKENKPGKDFNGPVMTVWNHNLRRGEVLPVRVIVERQQGFDGEITLKAGSANSMLTSATTVVGKDSADTMVFITADEKATSAELALSVTGDSSIGQRLAKGTTTLWNSAVSDFIEPARWRFTDRIVVGVREELFPVTITTDGKPVEVKASDKAKVRVSVVRHGEFKDAIKLKPAGIPGLEKAKEFEVAATATNGEYEVDVPALKLKPGVFTMWFTGTAKTKVKDKDASVNVYSQPVVLRVIEEGKKP